MSCDLKIKINNIDGTVSEISFTVPNVNSLSLDELADIIVEDKDLFSQIASQVNASKFPTNSIVEQELIEAGLPIGNYNIKSIGSLKNKFYTPNIRTLVDKAQEVGVPMDSYNVLLTDASFAYNYKGGIYFQDGKELFVTKPSADHIEPYLKYKILDTAYENGTLSKKTSILINSAVDKLVNSETNSNKLKKLISKLKENPIKNFILLYYTDSYFKRKIDGEDKIAIETVLNDEIFPEKSWENTRKVYSDTFIENLNSKIDRNGTMLIEDVNNLLENSGFTSLTEYVQEVNNKLDDGTYFSIAFEGDESVKFKRINTKPEFGRTLVNTEFYGEKLQPIQTIGGYNIIPFNGEFYVTDKVITSESQLATKPFPTLEKAIQIVTRRLNENRTFDPSGLKLQVKQGKNIISTYRKYAKGDRLNILDVELNDIIRINPEDRKLFLSHQNVVTFNKFFEILDTDPIYKRVITELTNEGINVKSILNTPEKVETFLYLKNQYEGERPYNLGESVDNYVDFVREPIRRAISVIEHAPIKVYEIINATLNPKTDNIYQIKEIERTSASKTTEIEPNASERINAVIDNVSKNYGVLVNYTSTEEIIDKFKSIIPDATRVRAFIYNGEIYINSSIANNSDKLHEFGHIVLGFLKKKNFDLYEAIINRVETLPDYQSRLAIYRNSGDSRAVTDLNEEIFVTLLGTKLNEVLEETELQDITKDSIQKMFQTSIELKSENVKDIMNMSLNDVFNSFGSALFGEVSDDFDLQIAMESRQITNTIEKLIKDNRIIEEC